MSQTKHYPVLAQYEHMDTVFRVFRDRVEHDGTPRFVTYIVPKTLFGDTWYMPRIDAVDPMTRDERRDWKGLSLDIWLDVHWGPDH